MIEKFVETLLPSINRSTIIEDANVVTEELRAYTLPSYVATLDAGLFSGDYQFKSDWMVRHQKQFSSRFRSSRGTVIESIAKVTEIVLARTEFVKDALEKELVHDLARDGITYPKATLLQLLDLSTFYSRYARRFLLMCYVCEIPEVNKEVSKDRPFSPIEVRQMEEQFQAFLSVMEVFHREEKQFVAALTSIPDMLVDLDNLEVSHQVAGTTNLNPMALGFIKHTWNPIYHIRIAVANWQNTRCLAAEAEHKALEYRLIQMRAALNGENNAALEKNIEYTEKRLNKLNADIAKLEKAR